MPYLKRPSGSNSESKISEQNLTARRIFETNNSVRTCTSGAEDRSRGHSVSMTSDIMEAQLQETFRGFLLQLPIQDDGRTGRNRHIESKESPLLRK